MDKKLMGVFAPITTPFTIDEKVDYAGLKRNMEFYAKSRLQGYLALGSNGENKSLTNEEKIEVLRIIIENKHPAQTVMAGCIFESTFETIEFARKFAAMGADYLTLLPPSYFKKQMTDDVLIRYFTTVADAVDKPCLVYNAPQFCAGTTLSVNVIKAVADHPNIVGVKDSSTGNIEKYLFAARDKMSVMAGSANFFMNAMIMGASGGILSLANAFPDITADLYDLIIARDWEKAFALNERIFKLNSTVSGKGGVAAVKYAMDLAGLAGGNPRLPLLPLAEEIKESIASYLKKDGMI
ncbi:MAG: dihydrodipicolinate synthase family protein [Saccharofermentanales bacterium]|jgi:4-hydroxy-2-oxoglutarate aldolase